LLLPVLDGQVDFGYNHFEDLLEVFVEFGFIMQFVAVQLDQHPLVYFVLELLDHCLEVFLGEDFGYHAGDVLEGRFHEL